MSANDPTHRALLEHLADTEQRLARADAARRRAEDTLAASEGHYQALVENARDGVFRLDPQGRFTYVNDVIVERSGRPRAWLLGRSCLELLAPEDRERQRRRLARVARGETLEPFELAYAAASGPPVHVEANCTPLFEGAQLVGVLGISRNISARRRAEQEVRHRAELERLITQISTDFINTSPEQVDQGIDRALAAIGEFAGVDRSYVFQLRPDGATADNTHEWCAQGIEPQIENLRGIALHEELPWLAQRLRALEVFHVPRVAELPRGAAAEKAHFEAQGIRSLIIVPMASGGTLVGFLGFDAVRSETTWADDAITLLRIVGDIFVNALERRRAENEVRASHERLTTVLGALDAVVYVVDPDTHGVLFANQRARDVFGDVVGRICWQVFCVGQSGPCELCADRPLLTAGGEPAGVHAWEAPNPTNGRWYAHRTRAIRWTDGRVVRLSLAVDVTEVKALRGMVPICAGCKKIRDGEGRWHPVEVYVQQHSGAEFTHGLCPQCLTELYPDCGDLG